MEGVRVMTLPGVFRPRSDAWLLAGVVRDEGLATGARVLDVFTGSGVLALSAARCGARAVTAIDLMSRAVVTARLNARINGLRVQALRGDLFVPVADRRFDLVTANPPYLPAKREPPRHGASRAWNGGHDGRRLIDRFCCEVQEVLAPGGTVALVQSSLCGTPETLTMLADRGFDVRVAVRRRGPLGPLAASRAALLEERGLIDRGRWQEELHVIVARRSRG
jgi:release factor glutamine methyltransferase